MSRAPQRSLSAVVFCLAALLGAQTSRAAPPKDAPDSAAAPSAEAPKDPPKRKFFGRRKNSGTEGPPDGRKFSLGLEGAILTAPPLRTRVVYVDPRFVGRSMALGGLGVFGRYRPLSFIGFDVGVRSGSVRLRAEDNDTTISSDQVMADAAVLLYLGRGQVSQFALSGGLGGLFHRVRYDLDSGKSGRQIFGAATFRLGAEAEFLVNRIAFVLSFRTYGVLTARGNTRNSGSLFEGRKGERLRAPVATFQTYLAGSAGIAYRF